MVLMRRVIRLAMVCCLITTLGGCASLIPKSSRGGSSSSSSSSSSSGDNSHLPTGKPYTVRGKTYRPYTAAHGFTEVGVASWYGPGFHGKTTANGEKYNQNGMTAAHKLLPFNTQIKVTNLENGKSTIVRINDRGPFVGDRIIDLSNKAASKIGMLQAGTARVRLETLDGGKPVLTPDGDMLGTFYVQIGAFRVKDNASKLMSEMKKQGFAGRVFYNGNKDLHYVQIGPFPSVDRAESTVSKLRGRFSGLFVVAD